MEFLGPSDNDIDNVRALNRGYLELLRSQPGGARMTAAQAERLARGASRTVRGDRLVPGQRHAPVADERLEVGAEHRLPMQQTRAGVQRG